MQRPSAEIEGVQLAPSDCEPSEAMLTRVVAPLARSFTKTSLRPFVSHATRLEPRLENATYRPSFEIDGLSLVPFASPPAESTLMRTVIACAAAVAQASSDNSDGSIERTVRARQRSRRQFDR